jgi:acetyl-CoA C-acetyltransferase
LTEAWIIDACRTPRGVGKIGKGALVDVHPQHLASAVLRALVARNQFDTAEVDDVVWGTSVQVGSQGGDLGRMAALDAGYDARCSGITIDRFCGSGISAVAIAASALMSGMEDLVVAGGTEMMSSYGTNSTAAGPTLMDRGNERLRASHPQPHQGVCADVIAHLEGISRTALDELAVESQARAHTAIVEGRFDRSLVPVHDPEGRTLLERDEYPRPSTTMEALAKLAPAFSAVPDAPLNEEGLTFRQMVHARFPGLDWEPVHHAGNSSGVVDGAAALLLASAEYASAHGLKPRARVVATANVGDDPTLMLDAPVPAARKVLAKAGMTVDDVDLFEVNEAFAVVVEKFIRELQIDRESINVNGGAIALGHPIGATGAILIGTVLDELERRDGQVGLVTMCAAGGMAPAIIVERI